MFLFLIFKPLSSPLKIPMNQNIGEKNKLKPIIEALNKEGNDLEIFQDLKKDFEIIDFFIKKDKKIRIPLFGGYSTGKSSLLNCIIGIKILPEGSQITTRKIVVIRNNEEEKYSISKTKFVQTNDEYYNFEDGEIIKNKDTPEKIYQFLEEENKNENKEDMFYLLKAPIFLFKKIKLDKNIKNKIEFIDFPGIDVDEQAVKEFFDKIVGLTDTFLFVNECSLISNNNNIKNIQDIVNKIEGRLFDFDYNSCLFVLNKSDLEKEINKEKKEKEIDAILFGNKFNSYFDFFKKKEKPKISISIFSSLNFLKYIYFYEEIQDFEKYINKVIEEIIKEKRKGLIEQLEKKLKNKLKIDFNNVQNQAYNGNEVYLSRLKNCLIEKGISEEDIENKSEKIKNIINYYVTMIKNLEKNRFYINSNINSLTEELEKKIIIAKEMTEKQFDGKIKNFINILQIIFLLLRQKSINKKLNDITKNKEQMEIKMKESYAMYEEYSKKLTTKIDSVFDDFLNKINDLINLVKLEKTKISEIKDKIKQFRQYYQKEISSLIENLKDEIFLFRYILEDKIKHNLMELNILNKELEEFNFSQKLKLFLSDSYKGEISTSLFGGIKQIYIDSIIEIIDFIKGKNMYLQNLEELNKDIENKWNSTIFKCKTILGNILKNASYVLTMIYETQKSKIDEKKIQNLYDKFVDIIDDNYIGEKKKGKRHGFGIYSFIDGSRYEGNWVENKREGFGKSFYTSKNMYEGEFKNNKKNGFGRFIKNDGNIFYGYFKEDWMEGIGIITYKIGDKYEGEFIKGKRNGLGSYYYNNGTKFEGEWKNSRKNGKGIFYLDEENKYEGYWEENRRILDNYIEDKEYIKKKEIIGDKQIKIEYIDGDIYQGEYNPKSKIIEGKGKYIFNNGDFYEGNFENNLFSGEGNYFFDGNNIIGIFKNGKPNGKCEIIYSNGNILKGELKDGKKEGIFSFYNKSKNKEEREMYKNDYKDK